MKGLQRLTEIQERRRQEILEGRNPRYNTQPDRPSPLRMVSFVSDEESEANDLSSDLSNMVADETGHSRPSSHRSLVSAAEDAKGKEREPEQTLASQSRQRELSTGLAGPGRASGEEGPAVEHIEDVSHYEDPAGVGEMSDVEDYGVGETELISLSLQPRSSPHPSPGGGQEQQGSSTHVQGTGGFLSLPVHQRPDSTQHNDRSAQIRFGHALPTHEWARCWTDTREGDDALWDAQQERISERTKRLQELIYAMLNEAFSLPDVVDAYLERRWQAIRAREEQIFSEEDRRAHERDLDAWRADKYNALARILPALDDESVALLGRKAVMLLEMRVADMRLKEKRRRLNAAIMRCRTQDGGRTAPPRPPKPAYLRADGVGTRSGRPGHRAPPPGLSPAPRRSGVTDFAPAHEPGSPARAAQPAGTAGEARRLGTARPRFVRRFRHLF